MKKMIQILLLLTMWCGHDTLTAQETSVKGVLDNVAERYNAIESYQIEMNFSMLRGFTGNTATESYTGTMEKSGRYGRNLFLDAEIHRFANAQLTVDTKNKTVTLSELEPEQNNPAEIGRLLDYFTKSQLVDYNAKEWLCELVSEQKNFAQLPYGKVHIFVDKNTFQVSKQVLFFNNPVPFLNKETGKTEQDYGRLVITMKHDFNHKIEERRLTDFVVFENNKNKRLKGEYEAYQFIDKTKQ